MITFFTTAKNFADKSTINQVNAIKSWTIGNSYNCEVILFQRSVGVELLNDLPNVRIIDHVRSNERGVPYINEMFCRASELAKYPVVCFLNADIVVSDQFVDHLIQIHSQLGSRYLIAGERLDTSFDFLIDFENKNWYTDLMNNIRGNYTIHPPLGSDVFCFPKGQYQDGSLPDLLVGRPGWDLFMIYHARKHRMKLVDLSPSYRVIHQDHDYSHKSHNESIKKEEDDYNLTFFPKGEQYRYVLAYCNYKFENGVVRKSYHNLEFKKFYTQEVALYKLSIVEKILLKMEIFFKRFLITYFPNR